MKNPQESRVCAHGGCGRPAAPRTATVGALPKFCPAHRVPANRSARARLIRRAAERGDEGAAELARDLGLDGGERVTEAQRLEVFAVHLGLTSPRRAAAAAGFTVSAAELGALEDRARREHPGLVEGRLEAAIGLAEQCLRLVALRLLACASALPPGQAAAALRQVGEALERLQGSAAPRPATWNVRLSLPGDRGE
jgi:hypothetical protein